jgi:NADH:ubiquinone oxidoreductase subunit F (NADH-binding)
VLLTAAPHLVLDGIQVAAATIGASTAYLYLRPHPPALSAVRHAVQERRRAGLDRVPVDVVVAADGFVAGEASAVVSRLSGGPALPRAKPPRVSDAGVGGRPTLVSNVESLAHVALIARHGGAWFRSVGVVDDPGTRLFTVTGAAGGRRVVEMPGGSTLAEVVDAAGGVGDDPQAVLLGGYHGAWADAVDVWDLPLTSTALAPAGCSVGAGVVILLPRGVCGLVETARVVRYLATESARQCGPCLFGLPALADAMQAIANTRRAARARAAAVRYSATLTDRGGCHHPDGTVRLVRSAFDVFAAEVDLHGKGICTARRGAAVLPVPVTA